MIVLKIGNRFFMSKNEVSSYSKVEWDAGSWDAGMPVLRFTWVKWSKTKMSQLDPLTVEIVRESNTETERDKDGEWVRSAACVNQGVALQYRCVCNLKRDGWYSSTSQSGRIGYAHGIDYSIGSDGQLKCGTPEQVVRETLIAFIASLDVPVNIKEHIKVRPLWQELLDDALANITNLAEIPIYLAESGGKGSVSDITINTKKGKK